MPRINIITNYNDKGLRRAQRDFANAKRDLAGFGTAAKTVAIGAAALGTAVVAGGIKLATMAEDAAVSDNRISQINRSMGLFGRQTDQVSKRVQDFAAQQAALTGIDDDVIKSSQAKLLTFKSLAKSADTVGGAFDRATKLTMDMAAAGFGTAETNAVALGKALENPAKGITALARSGVTFTAAEKKKIEALQKSGDLLGAQEIVLKAVEKQVGGTAQATAKTSDKMKWALGEIAEQAGGILLPTFEKVAGFVTGKILPVVQSFIDKVNGGRSPLSALRATIYETFGPSVGQKFDMVKNAVLGFIDTLKKIAAWVSSNRAWIEPLVVGVAAMIAAYKVWVVLTNIMAIAQAALNIVLAANPIGIVVLAIAGLIAAFVYLWKTNDGFRNALIGAWNAIRAAATAIWNGLKTFLGAVWTGIIAIFKITPLGFIITNWTRIVDWIREIPGKVKSALGNMATLLKDAGKAIIQGLWDGMKELWNRAKSWVTGIADWIKQNKGPLEKDRKLLVPAGVAIMQGLSAGLNTGWQNVASQLAGYTDTIGGSGLALTGSTGGSTSVSVASGAIQIILPPGSPAETRQAAADGVLEALARELRLQ